MIDPMSRPVWLATLTKAKSLIVAARHNGNPEVGERQLRQAEDLLSDVLAACPPPHVELAQDRAPGSAAATLRINPEVGQGSAAHSTSPLLAASPPSAEALELLALRAFVQKLADEEICEDAPTHCSQESGPYCGTHPFDVGDITDARELLARFPEATPGVQRQEKP